MPNAAQRLRELLQRTEILITPGVTDAFYARLAENAGFEAVFTTGAGIANTLLGAPDLGLTTMTEIGRTVRHVCSAVSIPVIADCDAGYGNHLNVVRTVTEMEHAGVGGIIVEDQVTPKRCGHFSDKKVIPIDEMVSKLVAARMAAKDSTMVLIARTDAIAVEGLASALARARAYIEAGADMIFVEAPRSVEEMREIPRSVTGPCLINLVEGGVTPLVSAADLTNMGYRLAIYANLALRIAGRAVDRAFRTLREEGTSVSLIDDMMSWEERQEMVSLSRWQTLDTEISEIANEHMSRMRREEWHSGGDESLGARSRGGTYPAREEK